MKTIRVKVTQVYTVTRVIYMDVDAQDIEEAIELVDSGAESKPYFNDPDWKDRWELQLETVTNGEG